MVYSRPCGCSCVVLTICVRCGGMNRSVLLKCKNSPRTSVPGHCKALMMGKHPKTFCNNLYYSKTKAVFPEVKIEYMKI